MPLPKPKIPELPLPSRRRPCFIQPFEEGKAAPSPRGAPSPRRKFSAWAYGDNNKAERGAATTPRDGGAAGEKAGLHPRPPQQPQRAGSNGRLPRLSSNGSLDAGEAAMGGVQSAPLTRMSRAASSNSRGGSMVRSASANASSRRPPPAAPQQAAAAAEAANPNPSDAAGAEAAGGAPEASAALTPRTPRAGSISARLKAGGARIASAVRSTLTPRSPRLPASEQQPTTPRTNAAEGCKSARSVGMGGPVRPVAPGPQELLLDVESLLPPLLEATYEQPLRDEQVLTVRRLCPEVDWLAQCAAGAPLPIGWKAFAAEDGNPKFENTVTGEVCEKPPWLPDFGYLARLILHVRMDAAEARRVGALLVTERDRCRHAVVSLQQGWSGPFRDRFTGQNFYHCEATGTSSWHSPAAPAAYQLKVVEMLMACRLFDVSSAMGQKIATQSAAQQPSGINQDHPAGPVIRAAVANRRPSPGAALTAAAAASAANAPVEQFDIFTECGSPRAEGAGDVSTSFFGGSFFASAPTADEPQSVAEAAAAVASAAAALAGLQMPPEPAPELQGRSGNTGAALRTLKQATKALKHASAVQGSLSARGEGPSLAEGGSDRPAGAGAEAAAGSQQASRAVPSLMLPLHENSGDELGVPEVLANALEHSADDSSSSSDSEAEVDSKAAAAAAGVEPPRVAETQQSKSTSNLDGELPCSGVPSRDALSKALQIDVDALTPRNSAPAPSLEETAAAGAAEADAASTPLRAAAAGAAAGPMCFDIADSPPPTQTQSTLNEMAQELQAATSTAAATTPLRAAGGTMMSLDLINSPPPVPPLNASMDLTLGQTAVSACAATLSPGRRQTGTLAQALADTLTPADDLAVAAAAAAGKDSPRVSSPPPLGKLVEDSDNDLDRTAAPGDVDDAKTETLPAISSTPASAQQSLRAVAFTTERPSYSRQLGSLPPPPEGARPHAEADGLGKAAAAAARPASASSKGRRSSRLGLTAAGQAALSSTSPAMVGGA